MELARYFAICKNSTKKNKASLYEWRGGLLVHSKRNELAAAEASELEREIAWAWLIDGKED